MHEDKLPVFFYKNCTVLPAYYNWMPFVGAYDTNGKPIKVVHRMVERGQRSFQAPFIPATKTLQGSYIYGGLLFEGFGHFILDSLPRLWLAREHDEWPIVWTNAKKLYSYQSEILDLLGVSNENIFIEESTAFETIHMPAPGCLFHRFFHPQLQNFLECHKAKNVEKGKKIYLSKRDTNKSPYANELDIENLLKYYGFTVVIPENLSIKDQLDVISSSEICVAIEGSALHSIVFIKNLKTNFFILPRLEPYPIYSTIAQAKNILWWNLKNCKEIKIKTGNTRKDIYELDINKFEHILKKTNGLEYNSKIFFNLQKIKVITNSDYINMVIDNIDINIDTWQKNFYYGYIYKKRNLLPEACKELEEACRLEPKYEFIYRELAAIYKLLDKREEMLEMLKKALSFSTDKLALQGYIVKLLVNMDRLDEALVIINNVFKSSRYVPWCYEYASKIFLLRSDMLSSIIAYEKLLKLYPYEFRYSQAYILLLVKLGKYNIAREYINKIFSWARKNNKSELFILYSKCFEGLHIYNNISIAIAFTKKSISIFPNKENYIFYLVKLFIKNNDFNSAKNILWNLLSKNISSGECYARLSNICYKENNLVASKEYIKKALQFDPNNDSWNNQLCNLLRKENKWSELEEIITSTNLDKRSEWEYFQLSHIFLHRNEPEIAIVAARKAVSLRPEKMDWLQHLITLLMEHKLWDEAECRLWRALWHNPRRAWVRFFMSRLYYARFESDLNMALQHAENAHVLEPQNIKITRWLSGLVQKRCMLDK